MDRDIRPSAGAASRRGRPSHASSRLTTYLVPAIIAQTICIGAIGMFLRPVRGDRMSIPQSKETRLINLRDISTCPLSFY